MRVCVCRGAANSLQWMYIGRAVSGSDVSLRRYVMCVISKQFMGSSWSEKLVPESCCNEAMSEPAAFALRLFYQAFVPWADLQRKQS